MSRHRPDVVSCLQLPGSDEGLLCFKCEGKCPTCDSFVHPVRPVRICEECAAGRGTRCIICQMPRAATPAFYCRECVELERDRDGCPVVVNLGSNKTDRHFNTNK